MDIWIAKLYLSKDDSYRKYVAGETKGGNKEKDCLAKKLIVKNFGNGSKRNFWFPLKKTGGLEADFYCHLCWGRDSVMLNLRGRP